MKITSVQIKNFLSIGSIECSLEDKGLVLIQGENLDDTSQDSNGSGKSSLPDAISWCLYGVTARGQTGDAVINKKSGKNCYVSVILTDEDQTWIVIRNRKNGVEKNRLKLTGYGKGGIMQDLAKGTDKLTQVVLNEILGCSQEVFMAAVYAGQEHMPDLPSMTDKALKVLVEEAAGIDVLQRAFEVAKVNLNTAKTRIDSIKAVVDSARQRCVTIDADVNFQDKQSAIWIKSNETTICDLKIKAKSTSTTLQESVVGDKSLLEDRLLLVRKIIFDSPNVENKREELQSHVAKAHRVLDVQNNELRNAKKTHQVCAKNLTNVKAAMDGNCETCGRKHDEVSRAASIKVSKATWQVSEDAIIKLEAFIIGANNEVDKRVKALNVFQKNVPDLSAELNEKGCIVAEIQKIEMAQNRKDLLTKFLQDQIDHIKKVKNEINPHLSAKERSLQQRVEQEEIIDLSGIDMHEAEEQIRISEGVHKMFGQSGVRAHILDTVTPFLNSQTNTYLTALTDENISAVWSTLTKKADGSLKESFNISVTSKTGAESFRGLSGGEKRKVRLACSMALQDLVSSRATKPIQLYIADEIDDALDEQGLERLMGILDKKAKDKGTVLVISHNSLSDWIRQVVTIQKRDGLSSMVGNSLK